MAAGGHFEKHKLCIDLKWREIQNGPNRISKMAAGAHFEKKNKKLKLRIDLKWREMR